MKLQYVHFLIYRYPYVLNIVIPKSSIFLFVSNGNYWFKVYFTHITLKCLSIGTPKIINFPFVSNGKLMILGVPIYKQIIMRLYSA